MQDPVPAMTTASMAAACNPSSEAAQTLHNALDSDLINSSDFRMYCFKVLPCTRRFGHDWTACPFHHPGEKATRRCPQKHTYLPLACPDVKKTGECPRGTSCHWAHNVFEFWCHPLRFRTQLCSYGGDCKRSICFFAHSYSQLRVVDQTMLQELERQMEQLGEGPGFGFPPSARARAGRDELPQQQRPFSVSQSQPTLHGLSGQLSLASAQELSNRHRNDGSSAASADCSSSDNASGDAEDLANDDLLSAADGLVQLPSFTDMPAGPLDAASNKISAAQQSIVRQEPSVATLQLLQAQVQAAQKQQQQQRQATQKNATFPPEKLNLAAMILGVDVEYLSQALRAAPAPATNTAPVNQGADNQAALVQALVQQLLNNNSNGASMTASAPNSGGAHSDMVNTPQAGQFGNQSNVLGDFHAMTSPSLCGHGSGWGMDNNLTSPVLRSSLTMPKPAGGKPPPARQASQQSLLPGMGSLQSLATRMPQQQHRVQADDMPSTMQSLHDMSMSMKANGPRHSGRGIAAPSPRTPSASAAQLPISSTPARHVLAQLQGLNSAFTGTPSIGQGNQVSAFANNTQVPDWQFNTGSVSSSLNAAMSMPVRAESIAAANDMSDGNFAFLLEQIRLQGEVQAHQAAMQTQPQPNTFMNRQTISAAGDLSFNTNPTNMRSSMTSSFGGAVDHQKTQFQIRASTEPGNVKDNFLMSGLMGNNMGANGNNGWPMDVLSFGAQVSQNPMNISHGSEKSAGSHGSGALSPVPEGSAMLMMPPSVTAYKDLGPVVPPPSPTFRVAADVSFPNHPQHNGLKLGNVLSHVSDLGNACHPSLFGAMHATSACNSSATSSTSGTPPPAVDLCHGVAHDSLPAEL